MNGGKRPAVRSAVRRVKYTTVLRVTCDALALLAAGDVRGTRVYLRAVNRCLEEARPVPRLTVRQVRRLAS